MPKEIPTTPDFALGKVAADKKSIVLEGDKGETVTIVNGAPGQIRLSMPKQLGLDLQLQPTELAQGEKAILTVKSTKTSVSGVLGIEVIPTGEVIGIRVVLK
jgi:hypothetical protein